MFSDALGGDGLGWNVKRFAGSVLWLVCGTTFDFPFSLLRETLMRLYPPSKRSCQ